MNIWHIALNDLKKTAKGRVSLALLLVMPVFMIFLMGNALKPSFELEKGAGKFQLGYYNGDRGMVGENFDVYLKGQNSDLLQLVELNQEPEPKALTAQLPVVIVLPQDLSARLEGGQQAEIKVLGSGKDPMRESFARLLVDTFTDQFNAVQDLGQALPKLDAKELQQSLSQAQAKFSSGFVRPVSQLNPKLSSFEYFAASMLVFFLLTSGMGVGLNILTERADGTFQRVQSFPVTKSRYLLGKILANSLVGAFQALAVVLSARYLFDVNWGQHPFALVPVVLSVILISGAAAVVFSSLVNSPRAFTGIAVVAYWLMTFISGGFSAIPLLEPLAKFTVNKWAFGALSKLMTGSALWEIRSQLAVLFSIVICLWCLGLFLYNRRVSHE